MAGTAGQNGQNGQKSKSEGMHTRGDRSRKAAYVNAKKLVAYTGNIGYK